MAISTTVPIAIKHFMLLAVRFSQVRSKRIIPTAAVVSDKILWIIQRRTLEHNDVNGRPKRKKCNIELWKSSIRKIFRKKSSMCMSWVKWDVGRVE